MRLQSRPRVDEHGDDSGPVGSEAVGPLGDSRVAAVLRLMRGEPLLTVAEEVDVPPAVLLGWRDAFLEGGHERLDRPPSYDPPQWTPRPEAPRRPNGSRPRTAAFIAVGAAVALIAVSIVLVTVGGGDDLSKGWLIVHDGFGKAGVERSDEGEQVHFLKPMIAQAPDETHGALKTTERAYRDVELQLRMRTVQQLRAGSPPNPWETAWAVWHYTDDRHFYYLSLKPNGWELGKRDPDYPGGQRFLASDVTPTFYFTQWYDVRIEQVGPTITVWVGGLLLTRFIDLEQPYHQGKVGLYVEDAYAQFSDIEATGTVVEAGATAAGNPGDPAGSPAR